MSYLPYDLTVVSKEKLSKKEYFTVSATGVMHIKKGRDAHAEFTSLSDWVHEKIMFGLLKKLKFYRFFFEVGCFTRWHKARPGSEESNTIQCDLVCRTFDRSNSRD